MAKAAFDHWQLELPDGYSGKLFVFTAPNPAGSPAAFRNLTLSVEDLPAGVTVEQFKNGQMKAGNRLTILEVNRSKLSGVDAIFVTCSSVSQTGVPLQNTLAFIVLGNKGYTINATTGAGQAPAQRKEFEAIFQSFRAK